MQSIVSLCCIPDDSISQDKTRKNKNQNKYDDPDACNPVVHQFLPGFIRHTAAFWRETWNPFIILLRSWGSVITTEASFEPLWFVFPLSSPLLGLYCHADTLFSLGEVKISHEFVNLRVTPSNLDKRWNIWAIQGFWVMNECRSTDSCIYSKRIAHPKLSL